MIKNTKQFKSQRKLLLKAIKLAGSRSKLRQVLHNIMKTEKEMAYNLHIQYEIKMLQPYNIYDWLYRHGMPKHIFTLLQKYILLTKNKKKSKNSS